MKGLRQRTPTLSLCVISAGDPQRVRLLLEAWRPHVDEVVLALDERGPHEAIAAAVDGLVDRLALLPPMPGMEPYLGWTHAQCSGDWILRADDDELPSRALLEALPALVAERELTHYWLPRRWPFPDAAHHVDEGLWARDIQLRLVRNVPGIWRFSGLLHSNIEVEGAGRVVDTPLLHVTLLLSDADRRRAKAEAYERQRPGILDDLGRPINHVFVPEDEPDLRVAPLDAADAATVERFLGRLGEQPPVGRARQIELRPSPADVARWTDAREIDDHRARVRLVHPVRPMPAGSTQHIQVEVMNLSLSWWPRGPAPCPEVSVGHRWRRADGTDIPFATLRTPFTESVAPGATTRLTVAIQAPPEPGDHDLLVGVVHEWVRWFDGAAQQTVSVESPRR